MLAFLAGMEVGTLLSWFLILYGPTSRKLVIPEQERPADPPAEIFSTSYCGHPTSSLRMQGKICMDCCEERPWRPGLK